MPIDTIEGYFKRVQQICEKDNGKLWGKPVYASILVIDRITRTIVANEADNDHLLKKKGRIFTGKFPENLIIANSTTPFGGKHWTMLSYPFDREDKEINLLFTHELFHRLQYEMGIQDNGYDNSHMGNVEARIYLKMEWLALLRAINSKDTNLQEISNALLFRAFRRSLFSGSDSMENKFEIAEGLAEYTAYKLCSDSISIVKDINERKDFFWNTESYVRSFGYYSGCLYAFLLDKYGLDWRKNLKYNDDLGGKLKMALHISLPENIAETVKIIKNNYGYAAVYNYEHVLKKDKDRIFSDNKNKFTATAVVKFNLIKPHYGFNPNNLQPLDSLGTVYPTIELVDDWGKLKVTEGGCLLSKDFKIALVSSVDIIVSGSIVTAKGWTLKMDEAWEMIKNEDQYILKKKN